MQDERDKQTIDTGDVGTMPAEVLGDDDKPAEPDLPGTAGTVHEAPVNAPEKAPENPAAEPEVPGHDAEPDGSEVEPPTDAPAPTEPEQEPPAVDPTEGSPDTTEPATPATPAPPVPAVDPLAPAYPSAPPPPAPDPDAGKNQPAKEGAAIYGDETEEQAVKGAAQAALDRAAGKVAPDDVARPSEPPKDLQSVGIQTGKMLKLMVNDKSYALDLGHPLVPAPALLWALLAWSPEQVEGFFADLRIQRARGLIVPLTVTRSDPPPL